MPDLEMEIRHLALAEQHVALGERSLARLRETLASADPSSPSWGVAHNALKAIEDTQALFIQHRDSILATVEKLTQGKA